MALKKNREEIRPSKRKKESNEEEQGPTSAFESPTTIRTAPALTFDGVSELFRRSVLDPGT